MFVYNKLREKSGEHYGAICAGNGFPADKYGQKIRNDTFLATSFKPGFFSGILNGFYSLKARGIAMLNGSTRVLISWLLYDRILECDLTPKAFKILIGVLSIHDELDDWSSAAKTQMPEAWLKLSEFRKSVGLAGNRDARAFRDAVEELKQSELFDEISITPNGRIMEWTFDPDVWYLQQFRETYVLLTLAEIAVCKTQLEYQFVCEMTRTRRMGAPQFDFSRLRDAPRCSEHVVDWKRLKPRLLGIMNKWMPMEDGCFVIGLVRPRSDLKISDVIIRLYNRETNWSKKALLRLPPSTEIYVFEDGKMRST